MRNRYYDTARLYEPIYQNRHPSEVSRGIQDKQTKAVPSTKLNDKNAKASSEAAMNDPNQEAYMVDDSRTNDIDDDDSQIKYIYSLYKSRLSDNF